MKPLLQTLCHVCHCDGAWGFGLRGNLAFTRWFCSAHRPEGEAYWRQINDN